MKATLYPYIWAETDGNPRRILANEAAGTMTLDELSAFQRELDGVAELAVVMDGRTVCYI
jgi:hypothetical protein